MLKKALLLVFTRNPERGKVKKRLAADIGPDAALEVYLELLKHIKYKVQDLNCAKRIYFSEALEKGHFWEEKIFEKKLQKGEYLGNRMKNAFEEGFADGFEKIVIIGSDLYELKKDDLEKAFLALEDSDFVIGPAEDGGYYLLGMKKIQPQVFRNKSWGTSTVFQETMDDLAGEKVVLLETKNDIDNLEDLKKEPQLMKLIKNDVNLEL